MSETDALWAACLDRPDDDVSRGAFADRLTEGGFDGMADAIRGSVGTAFVSAASYSRPAGDFVLTLLATPPVGRRAAIHEHLEVPVLALIDVAAVNAATATSNAYMWSVDSFEVGDWRTDGDICRAPLTFTATGEQDDEQWAYGHHLTGMAVATIGPDGAVSFEGVTAEMEPPDVENPNDPDDD